MDDHKAFRQWVRSKLESSQRFEIAGEAGDGREAVAKAHGRKHDLVLLDFGLPGISGLEVATFLRRQTPGVKILFLSLDNDPEVITAALNDGAHGFVLKCDAERELLPAMEAVLRGYTFTSKGLAAQGFRSC